MNSHLSFGVLFAREKFLHLSKHSFESQSSFSTFSFLPAREDTMIYPANQLHDVIHKHLTSEERLYIITLLLSRSHNGVLDRGGIKVVARTVRLDKSTIYRIWTRFKHSTTSTNSLGCFKSRTKENPGRKS
jgi:hypothetical protein